MPRIEITLSKIQHNARILCELYGKQGISLMGVSKAVLGEPIEILKYWVQVAITRLLIVKTPISKWEWE